MKKLDKLSKFLEGVGSVMSLYPDENRRKITLPDFSVSGVLGEDWKKIGLDMWKVCRVVESQQSVTNKSQGQK